MTHVIEVGNGVFRTPCPSARLVRGHESSVGGGEHAGTGFDVLAKVLGANQRMFTAHLFDLVFQKQAIVSVVTGDTFARYDEDAPEAVASFHQEGGLLLTLEERIAGPGRAGEDASGVAGGSHGGETPIIDILLHILGLVDNQKTVGSGTDDISGRVGGKVGDMSRQQLIHIAISLVKIALHKKRPLGGTGPQAVHGIHGLRAEGGLGANDRTTDLGQAGLLL
jgi:hypothetical protein